MFEKVMQEYKDSPWNVKLKILRKMRGWSKTEAAEQIGVTVRTYYRWEEGVSDPENKKAICSVFEKDDIFKQKGDE